MKVVEFNKKKIFSEGSGSSALVDHNINMVLNEYGVYEEKTLLGDGDELNSLVEYVSPNLNDEVDETVISKNLYENVNGIKYDEKLGYYLSLYVGYVEEGDYRENGSSGGMGTWILKELFEKKLIDGVIHVKENKDKNSKILFQYDISKSIDEIKSGSKTKYYPVEFSSVLKKIKEGPGRYAIVGIPSFIMAIRLLSEKDQVIKERIKYTIGIVCGHQKSSKFAESLAWQVGIKPNDFIKINFRKKLPNKTSSDYGVEIVGKIDDEIVTIVKPIKELIGQNWGEGYFKTIASDFTDDVMNETSDITLGDAWLPEYEKDDKGNNIVIVRDPIIEKIIIDGIGEGKINLNKVESETIIRSQLAHYRHTHDELAYRLFKKDKNNNWRPKKRVLSSNNISFLRRKVQDAREEISCKSHLLYKKAVELDDIDYFKKEMKKLSNKYNNIYKLIRVNDALKRYGVMGVFGVAIKKIKKQNK